MSDREFVDLTGRHRAKCCSIQLAEGKNAVQVVIGFELLDNERRGSGQFITYFGSLSDAAIDFTVEALRNCGWRGDDLSELPELAESGGLGDEVMLDVVAEQFEGKWRNKVKWVNKPGGKIRLEKALSGDDLRSFASRMKSRVRAAGRDSTPKRGGGGYDQRDVPPPGDDDLPW